MSAHTWGAAASAPITRCVITPQSTPVYSITPPGVVAGMDVKLLVRAAPSAAGTACKSFKTRSLSLSESHA